MSLRSEFEAFKLETVNKFKAIDREVSSCNSCLLDEFRKRQTDGLLFNERRLSDTRDFYKHFADLRERIEKLEKKGPCPDIDSIKIGQYYERLYDKSVWKVTNISLNDIEICEVDPETYYKKVIDRMEFLERYITSRGRNKDKGIQIGQYYSVCSNIYQIIALTDWQVCIKRIKPNKGTLLLRTKSEVEKSFTLLENYHE